MKCPRLAACNWPGKPTASTLLEKKFYTFQKKLHIIDFTTAYSNSLITIHSYVWEFGFASSSTVNVSRQ